MQVLCGAVVRVSLFLALAVGTAACPKWTSARLERPAPPSEGVADARVVFVAGDVGVTPAQGAAFPAKVGVDLVADDRIAPATSAKIVVVLRNGHAVRLDDTGALAVKDILLFHAPATDRDVAEQLAALLDPGETIPLDDVRDRAAAWRQMLRAGESAGRESSARDGAATESVSSKLAVPAIASVESPPPPTDERAKNEEREPKKRAPQNGPARKHRAQGEEDKGEERQRDEAKPDPGGRANEGLEKIVSPPPPPPPPPPQGAPSGFVARFGPTPKEAAAIAFPDALVPIADELGRCLAGAVNVAVASVDLLVEVRAGSVARVRIAGALPVPACARALVPTKLDVGDGWLVVTVPLGR